MRFIFSILIMIGFSLATFSQKISTSHYKLLQQKEDSMKQYGINLIQGINAADRFKADSMLTKMLVRALKVPHSFYYPFDSLFTISKQYAPDSTFRIYTWQMVINDNIIRQHGAIQMRTEDGSLKLFPLIDKSDITLNMEDSIGNHLGWMGAVYYKVLMHTHQDKKIYTLLGFDENNIRSNKKIVEVLRFEKNEPVFGGNFFSVPTNSLKAHQPARYIMEFKKEAGPRLTYDTELGMIIFEHLISESNEPNKKWTLIGDGDYEGFVWRSGKWVYVSKVFNDMTPEGNAPVPQPVKENKELRENEAATPNW